MSALVPILAATLLQGPIPGGMLGQALLAVVAIGVIVVVGRIVLSIAWKLVLIASVVIGLLWVVSLL
jgi:hypothetical protein